MQEGDVIHFRFNV
ncbi:MAG: hypothetical protein LBN32_03795 [Helicobacteraceae bacterium]|nr:hypothetical protein [Helicobacteraceae bacterium]